ncbi:hypothetical protein JG688_00012504 [Phytophthora aleatoria]|uniref:Uncharacterized protein n=1 Tax=Phytophthora aleatoria TaxID=2496075 RepID=A0A8J5IYG6_9STRA|nr:hypothetical protein JG688_00012504 [Phytophthora aleatoria]
MDPDATSAVSECSGTGEVNELNAGGLESSVYGKTNELDEGGVVSSAYSETNSDMEARLVEAALCYIGFVVAV